MISIGYGTLNLADQQAFRALDILAVTPLSLTLSECRIFDHDNVMVKFEGWKPDN